MRLCWPWNIFATVFVSKFLTQKCLIQPLEAKICGHIDANDVSRLIADFMWADSIISRSEAKDSYNVAPGTFRPVLHMENDQLVAHDLHWGYRSVWVEASGKVPMAIKKRAEKNSNSYWRELLKAGRSIVTAFGWYEWTGEKATNSRGISISATWRRFTWRRLLILDADGRKGAARLHDHHGRGTRGLARRA